MFLLFCLIMCLYFTDQDVQKALASFGILVSGLFLVSAVIYGFSYVVVFNTRIAHKDR